MPTRVNRNIGIFGVIGAGKTTYALKRAADSRRLIVFNTLHFIDAREAGLGWTDDIKTLIAWTRERKTFRICYQPSIKNKHVEFEMVIQLAELLKKVTLMIDEVDVFCSPSDTPQVFYDLIMYGRHPEVSTIYTARRFANVSRDLTSQTHELIVFRQEEPVDLDAARQRFGKEWSERISQLPNYHAVRKSDGVLSELQP